MAINKNHEFEELNGVKCGIADRNVNRERADFLASLLVQNGYEVITVPSPAPRAAPVTPRTDDASAVAIPLPATYTVGVTDYTFNPINAIFGRTLKTSGGEVVTLAFWKQL